MPEEGQDLLLHDIIETFVIMLNAGTLVIHRRNFVPYQLIFAAIL